VIRERFLEDFSDKVSVGQFELYFEGIYAISTGVGADLKILHIDGEIVKLREELEKPGANAQKIQDRIDALVAARSVRLKELETTARNPERQ
jgi:hypothetical protein